MYRNDGMTFPLAIHLNSSSQMKYDFVLLYAICICMYVYPQSVRAKDKQTHIM